jgi:DNA repair exonuclease SbcCD ATPase subunit
MDYLDKGKRYYRRRTPIVDEILLMEKEYLSEYNEFLKEKIKDLETELQILKNKINSYETKCKK